MAELMRETFLEHGAERAVAAGRGRPRQRARDPRGHGRRAEPDVQRAHGHLVLGPRALARRRARVPALGVRRGRQPLRPRHLEHEGRARLLRRGAARAGRRRRDAARRLHDRRRLRRDREDPVRRRPGRAVPRLCRRLALPRQPRRRRRHVHPRRADRGQGRARPLRLALAAHRHAGQLHPHRVLARASAISTRSCACTRSWAPCWSGSPPGRATPRTPTAASPRSSTWARSPAGSAGASRARRTTPISSSTSACRRRSRWRSRAARSWRWCAACGSASPPTASRARST